jgi:hypothetical protein
MFQDIVNRVSKMGAVGVAVSTFVGGAVGHVLNSPDAAAALAQMAATAAGGPVWKGAVAAGLLAMFTKAVANAKPQP